MKQPVEDVAGQNNVGRKSPSPPPDEQLQNAPSKGKI